MMRRLFLLIPLLGALSGCTDTADSIAREYRNTNNEALDGMMMVTSNTQAKRMTTRVFKPLKDRYQLLKKKFEIWVSNHAKNKELIEDMYTSNGVHLYLTELEINKQRYSLEMTRLRNLVDQYVEREKELRRLEGNNDMDFDHREVCPDLFDVVNAGVLAPLQQELESGTLANEMKTFPGLKVNEYPELFKIYLAKREIFGTKREFQLVALP